jgi:DnaJ domain
MGTSYCKNCYVSFTKGRHDQQFCSAKCVAAYYRNVENPEYIHEPKDHNHLHWCEQCGKGFRTNDYAERGGKREPKYCSTACKQKAYRARGKATQQQAHRRQEKTQAPPPPPPNNSGSKRQAPPPPPPPPKYKSKWDEYMALLGLVTGFSKAELKKAYMAMIKKWHPDVCKDPSATEMSQKINVAYEYLKTYAK